MMDRNRNLDCGFIHFLINFVGKKKMDRNRNLDCGFIHFKINFVGKKMMDRNRNFVVSSKKKYIFSEKKIDG
jgi:hypothetical protein